MHDFDSINYNSQFACHFDLLTRFHQHHQHNISCHVAPSANTPTANCQLFIGFVTQITFFGFRQDKGSHVSGVVGRMDTEFVHHCSRERTETENGRKLRRGALRVLLDAQRNARVYRVAN